MKDSEGEGRYDDIIDLPHHVSPVHPSMSMQNRAAQFAPFAALTGYEAVIDEAGRLTQRRIELSEGEKETMNGKLAVLAARLPQRVTVIHFIPDSLKAGGRYLTETVTVRRIDPDAGTLNLAGGGTIALEDLADIEPGESADDDVLNP